MERAADRFKIAKRHLGYLDDLLQRNPTARKRYMFRETKVQLKEPDMGSR
jgi:hypothetical protein